MPIQLHNDQLSITISERGAELRSVLDLEAGLEYLWQADSAWWGRSAPVLFPFIGRLKGDRYRWKGLEYPMGQHGFARDRDFELIEHTAQRAVFELRADAETRQRYPFGFSLQIAWQLEGRSLSETLSIHNHGEESLPFSIGLHPAFNCPLQAGESFDDYRICFEQAETAPVHLLAEGLRSGETRPFLMDQRAFPLHPALFIDDALIFKGLGSEWVELRSRKSDRGLRVSLKGWPWLGIWTKPGAPFVCIEPWLGITDSAAVSGELAEKEGLIQLPPGGHFSCNCSFDFF